MGITTFASHRQRRTSIALTSLRGILKRVDHGGFVMPRKYKIVEFDPEKDGGDHIPDHDQEVEGDVL